ncbi:hypothetical protein STANM337S_02972 [Streptomyces tanashiensis]
MSVRSGRSVAAAREAIRAWAVPGSRAIRRADHMGVHIGPGGREAGDLAVPFRDAEVVGERGEPGDDVGAVETEDLVVQAQDRREVLRRRRADRNVRGGRGEGEAPAHHLRPARLGEAQLLVERLPVRRGVQRERGVPGFRQDVLHQPAPHALTCVPLGDEHHADRGEPGTVRGDHGTGGKARTVGVVDAVPGARGEQQAPLVFLTGPSPVLGEVGAGEEVLRGEAPDGELSKGCGGNRHAFQAVRRDDLPSTSLRDPADPPGRYPWRR